MFASLVFRQAVVGTDARVQGNDSGGAEGVREGYEGPGVAAVRRASAREGREGPGVRAVRRARARARVARAAPLLVAVLLAGGVG